MNKNHLLYLIVKSLDTVCPYDEKTVVIHSIVRDHASFEIQGGKKPTFYHINIKDPELLIVRNILDQMCSKEIAQYVSPYHRISVKAEKKFNRLKEMFTRLVARRNLPEDIKKEAAAMLNHRHNFKRRRYYDKAAFCRHYNLTFDQIDIIEKTYKAFAYGTLDDVYSAINDGSFKTTRMLVGSRLDK